MCFQLQMMVHYTQQDTVTLSDTGGDGAIVQVNEVGHGQIDDIVIDDGGTGYEVGDVVFTTQAQEVILYKQKFHCKWWFHT